MKSLILVEKEYVKKIVVSALSDIKDHIKVMSIGGHIYTDNESKYMDVDTEGKSTFTLSNGETGYILGEDTIRNNTSQIYKMLNKVKFDTVINACDLDKNGDALFEYACSLIGIDKNETGRMEIRDLSDDKHIQEAYVELTSIMGREEGKDGNYDER